MSRARTVAFVAATLAAALGAGCAEPTQLVVVVSTDMTVPDEIDQVRVQVFHVGEALPTYDNALPLTPGAPPVLGFRTLLSFGAGPIDDDPSRRIRVVVDAIRAGRTLFTTEVRTSFARRKRLRLDVYLARRCIEQAARCRMDETCGLYGCVSPDVPVGSLPGYSGDLTPSGIDPRAGDAGVATDAGGATDAATTPDAGCPGAGTPCTTGNPCERAETQCPAGAPTCTVIGPAAAGGVCRAAAGPCDVEETCDGTSTACPADAVSPPSVTCRPAAGLCDLAETCDGTSPACPADVLAGPTITCRGAASMCDVAEVCSGTDIACPLDAPAPVGMACDAAGILQRMGAAGPVLVANQAAQVGMAQGDQAE